MMNKDFILKIGDHGIIIRVSAANKEEARKKIINDFRLLGTNVDVPISDIQEMEAHD